MEKFIYKISMLDDKLNISKFPIIAEDEVRYVVKLNSGVKIYISTDEI